MLRPSNPADLPGLLLLHARALPNQACSSRTLGKSRPPSSPLLPAISSWVTIRSATRGAWIATRAGLAAGVIAVEQRRGPACWDVTCLSTRRDEPDLCTDMLEAASQRIARRGGQRVLLLLEEGSPFQNPVRLAGFTPYVSHTLFVRPPGPPPLHITHTATPAMTPATPEGEFGAFRLFQRVAPIVAREAEGLTLADWSDSHEAAHRHQLSYLLQRDGSVTASASLTLHGARATLDCIFDPRSPEDGAALLHGVTAAHHAISLACLAPAYLPTLAPLLERLGFQRAGAYTRFARHVTARIKEPGLVPVGA